MCECTHLRDLYTARKTSARRGTRCRVCAPLDHHPWFSRPYSSRKHMTLAGTHASNASTSASRVTRPDSVWVMSISCFARQFLEASPAISVATHRKRTLLESHGAIALLLCGWSLCCLVFARRSLISNRCIICGSFYCTNNQSLTPVKKKRKKTSSEKVRRVSERGGALDKVRRTLGACKSRTR